ncbi:hypothetical protein LJ739_00300 [Aestuariibacter halophilus]|uniref:WD40-like Beta Propeller Repeat n=1 Tax=Fluctibacter halophilus TaxID=226011 RepID=A0ABS8G2H7_9ALTE|nr:hypothetical protein [Aestuariibacter halophilus]MCC2614678.1 hypothetical protein [Aestuariibacter halophilus]
MKTVLTSLLLIGAILPMGAHSHEKPQLPAGPYLGQTPPGLTPEVFAPGVVSTPDWGDAGRFSPDMKAFYVQRWRSKDGERQKQALTFTQTPEGWQRIEVPGRPRIPFVAPDGQTRHFANQYQRRTEDGWSEMQSIGSAFEGFRIMSLTVSAQGTYVFDEIGTNGNGLLRYSRWVDGKRHDPKPFGKAINTGTWNAHPYIAPDESYIMWDGERDSGFGSSDLYISFRQADGAWGEAINLGERVNTAAEEGGPMITPDGKYLFFNRMVKPASGDGEAQSDLFWVDARFIDALRPQ